MTGTFQVTFGVTIEREANSKHEAVASARNFVSDEWEQIMALVFDQDPITVVELDDNGDPIL